MTGIVQKIKTVTMGKIHDLLDVTIDMDSPSVLRQHVRDLETALDSMKNQSAIQGGAVRTLRREKASSELRITNLKNKAKYHLDRGDEAQARNCLQSVVAEQKSVDAATADLVTQEQAEKNIDLALIQLENRHSTMITRLHELERLDRDSKNKEAAAAALGAASKLVAGAANVSIDNIETKMRARNDVASEKFERAIGDNTISEDPDTTFAVDALLNELRNK